MDTPPEERFDSITQAASRQFRVPIALVTIIDETRVWIKSRTGLDICEADRDVAFCSTLVNKSDSLVVEDLRADAHFKNNPLVTDKPFIRFYAGVILRVEGHDVGTLCLMDFEPRSFSDAELAMLQKMSRMVTRQLELNVSQFNRNSVSAS
ncbi:MAG: GAF domain-containing protein [Henriciella sp.]|uniref:GAF domain-containing protein n=1 Tax=Henriciella sp. TaxID=1968823 RepID=UPI003C75ADC3